MSSATVRYPSTDAVPSDARDTRDAASAYATAAESLRVSALALADAADDADDQLLHHPAAVVRSRATALKHLPAPTTARAADRLALDDLVTCTQDAARFAGIADLHLHAEPTRMPVNDAPAVTEALRLLLAELASWGTPEVTVAACDGASEDAPAEAAGATNGPSGRSPEASVRVRVPHARPRWSEVSRVMSAFTERLHGAGASGAHVSVHGGALVARSAALDIRTDGAGTLAVAHWPIDHG
ncbi:hypothetical protein HJ588_14810 [Flexivirga sp. ID2601S]|uniref:Uncharacterized protein n=1 Tax=Flexivirga aerilata TaxID=1656889 RepID=A0A849AM10_9MICO|nr:hypothetical protein [Flexivirga aerilata]NNG40536.1 hypothetical protein [Flexivirga aerilata]